MASLSDVTVGSPTLASNINQIIDLLNGTVSGAITLVSTSATTANNPLNAMLPAAPAADCSVVESVVSGDAVARLATYVRSADGYGGIWGGKGPSITAHWYAQSNGWKTDESVTIAGALTVSGTTTIAALSASGAGSFGGNLQTSGTLTVNSSSSLDGAKITTDGAGSMTFSGTTPHLNGPGGAQITLGANANGDIYLDAGSVGWTWFGNNLGSLRNDGSVHAVSLFDNSNRVAIQGAHSAGQPIVSYGTGVPAALNANEVYFQLA